MAITELYTGTETITTTEWSLVNDSSTIASITTDGIYQFFLDVSALAATDLFRFRIYEKVRSADTQRIAYEAFLEGRRLSLWVAPSFILMNGWDGTLLKVAGTDRTITWSIRQVA